MSSSEKIGEHEFRKLSKHLPDLIFQFTKRPDGTYYVPIASAGIKNIFGCKSEDVADSFEPIAKVIHPEDLQMVIEKIELSALQLSEFEIEYRTCIPGRPVQWILARSTPELLQDGSVTWYGFNANITEQRETLEKYSLLSKKQEAILKAIPDLIFEIGDDHIIYDYHSQVNDLLAAPPELFLGKRFDEIIPKDAADILLLAIEETDQKGYSIGKQYSLTLPQGEFWFELSVAPFISPNQIDKRFIVLSRNITERKNNDDKLQQLMHAVEQSTSSIVITNLNGELEYVNKQFLNVTGYSYDEVIGENPRVLNSGYTKKEDYREMWNTIKSGGTWHGEFLNKKKDGHLFWEEVTISPVRNEDGEIINFLGIKNDISRQKKTDEKFRKIAWDQSHQVRGPLTDILGILSILKMNISEEEKNTLMEHLENAAKQLDQVIHKVINETKKII